MAVAEVVKYNGGPDVFAWKYPEDELGTWTQLIVSESQEAVLFKGGKALDVFQSGRHTLETENIPLLNQILKLPFGGRSPFSAEVWFVNKMNSLAIKWGTSSPIQIQDPKYHVFIPVRSFGQFGIRVENAKQFLLKLVGTLPVFDKASIVKYFRGIYLTKVKDSISSYLIHKQISIMEINAYLEELSVHLQEKMSPVLSEYGIRLVHFYVNDISVPEDDSAVKKLKDVLAKKAEMNILGYNYQQERSFDIMEGAAKNPGSSSGMMGSGIGLGMGVAMGGAAGNELKKITGVLHTGNSVVCSSCGAAASAEKRFCSDCGAKLSDGRKKETVQCSKCGFSYQNFLKFCPECGDRYHACFRCGADIPENAAVCPECGYELPGPCPACGNLLPYKDARFCPACGESLRRDCPFCHAEIGRLQNFCPQCGKKLESSVKGET